MSKEPVVIYQAVYLDGPPGHGRVEMCAGRGHVTPSGNVIIEEGVPGYHGADTGNYPLFIGRRIEKAKIEHGLVIAWSERRALELLATYYQMFERRYLMDIERVREAQAAIERRLSEQANDQATP